MNSRLLDSLRTWLSGTGCARRNCASTRLSRRPTVSNAWSSGRDRVKCGSSPSTTSKVISRFISLRIVMAKIRCSDRSGRGGSRRLSRARLPRPASGAVVSETRPDSPLYGAGVHRPEQESLSERDAEEGAHWMVQKLFRRQAWRSHRMRSHRITAHPQESVAIDFLLEIGVLLEYCRTVNYITLVILVGVLIALPEIDWWDHLNS